MLGRVSSALLTFLFLWDMFHHNGKTLDDVFVQVSVVGVVVASASFTQEAEIARRKREAK
jgi:hypothetical protein